MLVGLVGIPSSGKSTMFKALTLKDVAIADYPFTTIKANEGVSSVAIECPCKELNVKCNPKNSECRDGMRHIPIKLLDVAGLVKDAHKGRGRGNEFLDDLRQASALIHVLDVSGKTDSEGKLGIGNPEENVKILENEIDYWIFGIVQKNLGKIERTAAAEKTPLQRLLAEQLSGLGVNENDIKTALDKEKPETLEFARELRKISKPIIVAANKIDIPEAQKNFEKMKDGIENIVPCSADSELALKEADEKGLIKYDGKDFEILGQVDEKQNAALEFIKKNILEKYGSTGVQECLNRTVFEFLNMIVVYPVENENRYSDKKDNVLPDAIILKKDSTTMDLAKAIHSDIAEGMIGAIDARTKMKIGKDHELKGGDIIKIIFKG
ncbi:MAG: redox-regulated ATPase YchF [Candidatus Aenigmarchaeota archaeon]|nr:redox-regulated ATPase YchF [Candidatus Aenigmarchaeota archaeon]